ncbi:MAG: arsenate reductase ArsC [Aquificae bacterium]|nr:arsenate reductase ArsC [Aquificota bacterium]
MKRKNIGFICTGNSARSQIAEGFARYYTDKYKRPIEIYSAGSNPTGYIHKLAIEVMKEKGIDISKQKSKSIKDIPYKNLDIIVTLCSEASETCPNFSNQKVLHWNLLDPASYRASKTKQLEIFRYVRDIIEEKVKDLIFEL